MSTRVRRGRSNRCGAALALDPLGRRQGEAKQRRIEAGQLDLFVLHAFVPTPEDESAIRNPLPSVVEKVTLAGRTDLFFLAALSRR